MPFHTIVIEVPEGADEAKVEADVTRRLNVTQVPTGMDTDGLAEWGNVKVVEYHHEKMTEDASEGALTWESADTDEPLDQNAWCAGGVWTIGPDGEGGFSVEFIAKGDGGEEVIEDGVVLDNQPDEQSAKAAAQAYQDGAR